MSKKEVVAFYKNAVMLFVAAILGGLASCNLSTACQLRPFEEALPVMLIIVIAAVVFMFVIELCVKALEYTYPKKRKKISKKI